MDYPAYEAENFGNVRPRSHYPICEYCQKETIECEFVTLKTGWQRSLCPECRRKVRTDEKI